MIKHKTAINNNVLKFLPDLIQITLDGSFESLEVVVVDGDDGEFRHCLAIMCKV